MKIKNRNKVKTNTTRNSSVKSASPILTSLKNLTLGSQITLKLKDGSEIKGFLLPQKEDSTINNKDKSVFVKLDNGYNIGILIKNITSFSVNKAVKPKLINQHKILHEKVGIKKIKSKEGKQYKAHKPIISILHTGGTIASKVDYKTGAVIASFNPDDLLAMFPELKELAEFRSRLIGNFLSENLRPEHYNIIAKEVYKEIKEGADGVIITHGTDTLHYTSAALSFILEDLDKPVILVGAQRSSDRASSDAYTNLINAVFFIVKSDFSGVAVSMHENLNDDYSLVIHGCKVRKLHTSRRDAFRPINARPIAKVSYKKRVVNFIDSNKKVRKLNTVNNNNNNNNDNNKDNLTLKLINPKLKVAILKAFPGLSSEEVLFFKGYDGLVLEGTGLGHFPILTTDKYSKENNKIFDALKLLSKRTLLVMSSQTIFGRIDMNVYTPGRLLLNIGVLGNYSDMTPETTYIKLLWLLSNYSKDEIIKKKLITKNFRGELSNRTPEDFPVDLS